MADNNKAVGPLAAAKLVALIKAVTAKKYDKTGGKIEGSAEITGGLKVGMSSEFSSSINAGSEISSDMLLMAPIVALHDTATEESISFSVSGVNAAKVTSPVSGGGTQYARLAVGTPTGDNDAATKAYVDGHSGVITVTSTDVSDLGYDAEEGATKYSVTFDASFDSILANLAANKPMKFNITIPDDTGDFQISFNSGYFSSLGNAMYAFTGTIAGAPIVLSIGGLGSATVYLYADYLPEPNPDGSDSGKSLAVDGVKWAMKKAVVDDAMSGTSTNPVQNKVIKAYVDDHAAEGAVLYTAQTLTFEQKQQARKNIGALSSELPVTTGPVSLCPANVTDNNDAVHLTTTKYSGDDFTLTLDCGPENALVRVDGIRTPTDAQTNYAANVAYVKAKVAEVAASGGVDVDNALSATSTNPVQNKVVNAALDGKLDKTGGTLTGNLTGKYITGTWLQSTAATNLHKTPGKIAVLDDSGWVYYRTPSEILDDIGGASKQYVDDYAGGTSTKVTLSGTIEGAVEGYTAATYQQIVNEIAKNCNIWLAINGETVRLASYKQSGASAYKLVFFGAGSGALTVKYEVTASTSSAALTVTGG
mgnify:CR=1 FL=1